MEEITGDVLVDGCRADDHGHGTNPSYGGSSPSRPLQWLGENGTSVEAGV
ncbi:hypothetical protein OG762_20145 [Streptomyces sp. NBC_01136]|nr:hypothetical protein OG762_20145 [Streptomyces sp. NBC_01136]